MLSLLNQKTWTQLYDANVVLESGKEEHRREPQSARTRVALEKEKKRADLSRLQQKNRS